MENYEDFYKTICRVCLTHGNSENMVSLRNNASEDELSCFGKAVQIFANIRIKNDHLPENMCRSCLYLLQQAIVFKKKCEQSCKRLEKLIDKSPNSETEIKEKVTQYVLFINYFADENLLERKNKNKKSAKPVQKQNSVETEKSEIANSNTNEEDDFVDLFDQNFSADNEDSRDYKQTHYNEQDADHILENLEQTLKMDPLLLNSFRQKYHRNNKRTVLRKGCKKLVTDTKTENRLKVLFVQKQKPKKYSDTTCNICQKKYANSYSLKYHMKRHLGHSHRYVCERCAKSMATLGELQYHLASTHNIGKFFICNYCGFKVPRKFDLKEHIRIHTGERPYACEKCGLTFRRRYVWKKHALYHMERSVKCPRCPKKFVHRFAMQAHVNNVHERIYVYACSECDVTYAKPCTVRRHLVEKHGVPKEIQGRIKKINLGKSSILK